MTPLQRHWKIISNQHGLTVEIPHDVALSKGDVVTAEVCLKGYGASKGMLLLSDYSDIQGYTEQVVKMGYGFSCLSQPCEEEIGSDDGLKDMLDDWGRFEK